MEEKKLTDEEVIKYLEEYAEKNYEHCSYAEYISACGVYCNHKKEFIADMGVKNGEDCRTCDMSNIVETAIVAKQTLDLIHRLQSENERLTEEKQDIIGRKAGLEYSYNQVKEKNAELQKQVDELKAKQVIECHGMLKGCDMVNQAVKDTAKEIYGLAAVYYDGNSIDSMFFNELEERYGVEVE